MNGTAPLRGHIGAVSCANPSDEAAAVRYLLAGRVSPVVRNGGRLAGTITTGVVVGCVALQILVTHVDVLCTGITHAILNFDRTALQITAAVVTGPVLKAQGCCAARTEVAGEEQSPSRVRVHIVEQNRVVRVYGCTRQLFFLAP